MEGAVCRALFMAALARGHQVLRSGTGKLDRTTASRPHLATHQAPAERANAIRGGCRGRTTSGDRQRRLRTPISLTCDNGLSLKLNALAPPRNSVRRVTPVPSPGAVSRCRLPV